MKELKIIVDEDIYWVMDMLSEKMDVSIQKIGLRLIEMGIDSCVKEGMSALGVNYHEGNDDKMN